MGVPIVLLGVPMLHPDGRALLVAKYEVRDLVEGEPLEEQIDGVAALYAYPPVAVDATALARADSLRVVAAGGSGVDHIDVAAADSAGILVTHAVGAGARSVAEHAVGLILCIAKRLVVNDRRLRAGDFDTRWNVAQYEELSGKTIAIVGYGHIGRELARICRHGFDMRVIAVSRSARIDCRDCHGADAVLPLHQALPQADVVSLHVPLSRESASFFGAREFALMKSTAWFINTARGGIVDERALIATLQGHRIACAGIDVFADEPPAADNPLLTMENVVVSPHNAGITVQAFRALALAAARDIDAVLSDRRPTHLVNPATWPRRRYAPPSR